MPPISRLLLGAFWATSLKPEPHVLSSTTVTLGGRTDVDNFDRTRAGIRGRHGVSVRDAKFIRCICARLEGGE